MKGLWALGVRLWALAAAWWLVGMVDVSAQSRVLGAVPRLEQPVTLDGILSESSWAEGAPATDFVQAEPVQDAPSSERTEVRVVYDADALYIGAWCFVRDRATIVANSLRPDFSGDEEDTFEVLLDTFADSRAAFLFVTNPRGAKRDVQVSSGGDVQNVDWDAVWDVSARITDEGWFVEMRIPFSSLRYQTAADKPWRVNFGRRIRHHNELTYWTPVPRRFDITRVELAGALQGLDPGRLAATHNVWVKPYLTGRLVDDGSGVTPTGDVGGDVKVAITNGLTLDLTVNADFAQVEVDNQVVNLDRFSLFFPEKRDFFLENQGIFQIGTMGKAPSSLDPEDVAVFYSRRIGLSADRNPVPILGGARLTGRAGAWQVGLLNIQTGKGDGQDTENNTMVRAKRDVFARSEIGGFLLNRQGPSRESNQAYGVDAVLRPRSDLLLNMVHARSRTPGLDGDDAITRVEVGYDIRNLKVFAVHSNVGENYRNDLGFVKQSGVRVSRLELLPRFRPWKSGPIRELTPHYNLRYMEDKNGVPLIRKHTAEFSVVFRDSAQVRITHRGYFDRLQQDFEIQDDVIIPKGAYDYGEWTLVWTSDPSRMFSGSVTLSRGDFWNGDKDTIQVGARYRPSARFNTELTFAQDDVTLPGGAFLARVARLRLGYAFTTHAFLDAFLQYNSEDRTVASNIRFNLIHRPLSDIFVVFTENRPTYAAASNRVLSVKYTHLLPF